MVPGSSDRRLRVEGKPLEGFWHGRSLEYEAGRRGKDVDPETFIERGRSSSIPCRAGDI